MASSLEYVEFVYGQIDSRWEVSFRKMFGEYMIYINQKPLLLVCDNTVYIKKLDSLKDIMKSADTGVPYKGAKECYILDVENDEILEKAIEILEQQTPLPTKKK
ncbi:hypothetical protein BKH43_03505 [Helicobacter sp. 13S00401-1]|uniref:transcriptional regulator n=1 Tax=Helicobacter sp. 13S00401-1 TaxID=1905758 RepID=UPI000BA69762|nr:transcriptional regulator [Helicobacter sp. 13S00401-1]PAF50934.1 hypothetical protein BKH43_03505 [Helicobacter sp. 13S00401-1]